MARRAGLVTLVAVALTWIAVALGMVTKSVEAASNLPMPLLLLPFFGSGFVPTDSMPDPLRWFADNQPFTPIIETLRRLLVGGEIGTTGLIAVAWCVVITVVGYLWANSALQPRPSPVGGRYLVGPPRISILGGGLVAQNAGPATVSPHEHLADPLVGDVVGPVP